jgi:hypothetical protein
MAHGLTPGSGPSQLSIRTAKSMSFSKLSGLSIRTNSSLV